MPTSTYYLEINAIQSPFSIGNDTSARAMISFNVLCSYSGSASPFEEEICKIIQNAGLAILGTDMFFGSLAQLPQNQPGPFITIESTGGVSPLHTHDNQFIQRPSAKVITRATGYIVARNKANQVYNLLNGKHTVTVTT